MMSRTVDEDGEPDRCFGQAQAPRRTSGSGRPPLRRRCAGAFDGTGERHSTCSTRVDLPMPGSPPIRMAEPATMPPPQTRSNSSLPLRQRGSSTVAAARSVKAMARPAAAVGAAEGLRRGLDDLFDQRVPLAAGFATSRPARKAGAAVLADVAGRRGNPNLLPSKPDLLWMGPSARPCTNWSTWALPRSFTVSAGPAQMIRPSAGSAMRSAIIANIAPMANIGVARARARGRPRRRRRRRPGGRPARPRPAGGRARAAGRRRRWPAAAAAAGGGGRRPTRARGPGGPGSPRPARGGG